MNVKQVDVSATTGSFGILPNHVPAVAVLKPGLVTVYEEDNKTSKYFGKSICVVTAHRSMTDQGVWMDRMFSGSQSLMGMEAYP